MTIFGIGFPRVKSRGVGDATRAPRRSARRHLAIKLLQAHIALFTGLSLALALALITGHDADAVGLMNGVRQSMLTALTDPLSLLDARSPGGRAAGPLQLTKPHERVLSQVRDRDPPNAPAADALTDPLATGGSPGFAADSDPSLPGAANAAGPSNGQPTAPAGFPLGANPLLSIFSPSPPGSIVPPVGGAGSNPPSGNGSDGGTPPVTSADTPPGNDLGNGGSPFISGDPSAPTDPSTPTGDPGSTPGGSPTLSVPEPGSGMLILGGLLATAVARRRRVSR